MTQANVETYFEGTEWHCRVQGDQQPFHTSDTKERAVRAGRDEARARKVEHIIKEKDGSIGSKHSYGNDPSNVPG
ncbi:hypothetical protein ASC61_18075 [Aeromicrobium sp. Root344]|uniref:DUF2188 domain-containing protein n=1 Tax=Aeromicrobium sp. Root344 TaxID=1736521 RepID=UPI0006FB55B8|nr:DUF2188 domain-containing protein [Aeromicrobium sp. Root344]KQV76749.1 hypothetical protein ASC61_18075 [Aeromicrobium sp. Root344]